MKENEQKLEAEVLESNNEQKSKEITEKVNENETRQEKTEKIEEENKEQHTFRQKTQHKKNNKYMILGIVITIILILGLLISTIFALLNMNNNTILNGMYINDILVEGLTEEQAIQMLKEKFDSVKRKEINLKINGDSYSLTPEQIEVEYNIEEAVEQAYGIGRNGNIFQNNFEIIYSMIDEKKITIDITYNEQLLTNVLEGFNAKLPNSMVDNTYCIEENELIITRGIDGIVVDIETAKQAIINNIKNGSTEEIELKSVYEKCPEIDIEKIYSEVKSEPQNATYTTNPFKIIPHKNGLEFDIEEAKKIISKPKEEYVIKLTVTEPDILTSEIGEEAFPDLLSSFSTKYDETNVPRSKNVKLAMAKLNGVVVMPGEIFSYNKTLGKRTAEAGYEYANGFAGGKVVPMLAGGICQVSSTLYDAVLYANLGIVERYNHMFQATYVEPGKDATVVYGSLDFKFENTRSNPIMIKTTAKGGLAEVKIYGIKEEVEYEVDVITTVLNYIPYRVVYQEDTSLAPGQEKVSQWGLKGCKSITHRIVKLNGQEISKEVLSTDTYDPLNKIIKRGPAVTNQPTVDTSTTPEILQTPETQVTPEITEPEQTPENNQPENTQPVQPENTKPEAENSQSQQPQEQNPVNEGTENEQPGSSEGQENTEGTGNNSNTEQEGT